MSGCSKTKKPLFLQNEDDFSDEHQLQQAQSLIEQEQKTWLENAIYQLPNAQQTALNLCFMDELSNQQAATIMGLSLKALQSLIMRAKTKLKKQYQTDMDKHHETTRN